MWGSLSRDFSGAGPSWRFPPFGSAPSWDLLARLHLGGWHKNHYKNFTKEPLGTHVPPTPSVPETPPGQRGSGERKEGEFWQCWYLQGPAGRLR